MLCVDFGENHLSIMRTIIISILFLLFLVSCVHKSIGSELETFGIKFDGAEEFRIELLKGNIEWVGEYYLVELEELMGGGMYLFGKARISGADPNESIRVKVLSDDRIVKEYTVLELKKMISI